MKRSLKNKRLVVTGAARGIGEQVARIAASRGAQVTVLGLEPDRLAALAREIDGQWFVADVRDGDQLRRSIDDAAESLGGIDLLVANAGIVDYGTVRQANEAAFAQVLEVNLTGTFKTLKYATPHLEKSGGHVSVVASALSFLALPAMSSYSASKAGVEMLALAYRQEVAHLGVSVGLVNPSWIETDLVKSIDRDMPSFPAMRRRLPYPGNVTTSVNRSAVAIVDGLATRRPRVYVPRAVGVVAWAKAAVASPAGWLWARPFASTWVPRIEREIAARDARRQR